MNLKKYGFMPEMMKEIGNITSEASAIPARVTAVHRERYQLVCEYGEIYARLKIKEYYVEFEEFPTTGDFVLINYIPNSDSQIVKTLPRKTFFSRLDPTPGRGEQAVAANFDYVFVMQSLNHDFNEKRLERYMTLAWQSGATPIIVLTKADLLEEYEEYIRTIEFIAPGVEVYAVSSKTGYGMEKLEKYLKPENTVVFLGSSGVGKSSLVNALAGEEIMNVNGIREDDSKGRHTTTHRQLIMLKSGAMIIDTPGMRGLGMWDVSTGLYEAFGDVEQYLGKCRFSDCKHRTEPGCAIKRAIEDGGLSQERFESYLKLKNEARYSDDKTAYMRDKVKWHKEVAKNSKRMKADKKKYGGKY
ncbi:MAG: ribosome small subunit-dependent GTPase A [Lachnospiraceae bacterium]|nr:ribosome small subunit-dependent GTPase A [Lachnospiraceae bacterium]